MSKQKEETNVMTKNETTTAISFADIESELAALQEVTAAAEVGLADGFMTVQHGNMKIRGIAVPGNKVDVIVVGSIIEYAYYEDQFDPDNIKAPVCFSHGLNEKELKPHEASTKIQSENCITCPKNRFGSADNGKGKACKNTRKIAMISEISSINDVEKADVVYLKIPVTSVKTWSQYVLELASKKLSTLQVLTRITSKSHPKTQVAVSFEQEGVVPIEFLGSLLSLHKRIQAGIATIYLPKDDTSASHETEAF